MASGATVKSINVEVRVKAKGAIKQLNELRKAIKALDDIKGTVKKMQSATEKVKEAIDGTSQTAKAGEKAANKLGESQEKVAKTAKKASDGIKGEKTSLQKLVASVKRIAITRIIRAGLMALANAFREGLSMVKQFAAEVDDSQFTEMFQNYSAAGTTLKATLGVSLASILSALEPVLTSLATALSFVADAFNQFMAAIAGNGTYMKVNTDYVEEYTESLKEAKNQIMGFDELNKLSNTDGMDYEKLYDETEVSAEMVALGAAITIVAEALAAEGIAGAITNFTNLKNAVSDVTGVMGDKNTELETEAKYLATDAIKVGVLAGALVGTTGLYVAIKTVVDYLKEHPIEIGEKVTGTLSNVKGALEEAATWFEDTTATIKSYVLTALGKVKEAWENASTWFTETAKIAVVSYVLNRFADIKEAWNDVREWFKDKSVTLAVSVTDFFTVVSTAWSNAKTWLASKALTVTVGITDFFASVKEKIQEVKTWLSGMTLSVFFKLFNRDTDEDDGSGTTSKTLPALDKDTDTSVVTAIAAAAAAAAVVAIAGKIIGGGGGIKDYKLDAYADGGYPSTGSMFIAGEAGPELVGSINGKTGVASGDEVTGIRTAVYAIGEAIVDAINNKDTSTSIRLDDGSIYKASQRGAKRVGNSLISFAN